MTSVWSFIGGFLAFVAMIVVIVVAGLWSAGMV